MFSKRTLLGPVLLLVTVAISYPAYWLYAASLSGSFLQRLDQQPRTGSPSIIAPWRSGFPLDRLAAALEASNAEMVPGEVRNCSWSCSLGTFGDFDWMHWAPAGSI